jgi:endonuclease IV
VFASTLVRFLVSLSRAVRSSICLMMLLGHMFAAGYDIRTRETYEESIASFDRIVGLKYLKGMHINDSQGGGFNCKKDRHENIGL